MGDQNALQTRVVGPVDELLTELRFVFDNLHFGDRGYLRIVVTKSHDVEQPAFESTLAAQIRNEIVQNKC